MPLTLRCPVPRVLALHGPSLHGAHLRREPGELDGLGVELACPDAPHACPAARGGEATRVLLAMPYDEMDMR